jgi:hypothetical protein
MNAGSRKMEMLRHTQHLALVLTLVYMGVRLVAGDKIPLEILSYGLTAVAGNFASFAAANVFGDHRGKKDAPPAPPPAA